MALQQRVFNYMCDVPMAHAFQGFSEAFNHVLRNTSGIWNLQENRVNNFGFECSFRTSIPTIKAFKKSDYSAVKYRSQRNTLMPIGQIWHNSVEIAVTYQTFRIGRNDMAIFLSFGPESDSDFIFGHVIP